MNRDEIIEKGRFIYNNEFPECSSFELNLKVPFFDSKVKILALNLTNMESEKEIECIVNTINNLLDFDTKNEVWLKKAIWEHYEVSMSNTSYSMVNKDGCDNEIEANQSYFKIFNQIDAFNNVKLEMIWFDLSYLDSNYFNFEYHCPWEDEHGINIGILDGQLDSIQ